VRTLEIGRERDLNSKRSKESSLLTVSMKVEERVE